MTASSTILRIGLTLKLNDPKVQQELTDHMPEVRSRILLALSNKHPEDLAPLDGKRALATELKTLIEQPTDKGASPDPGRRRAVHRIRRAVTPLNAAAIINRQGTHEE